MKLIKKIEYVYGFCFTVIDKQKIKIAQLTLTITLLVVITKVQLQRKGKINEYVTIISLKFREIHLYRH